MRLVKSPAESADDAVVRDVRILEQQAVSPLAGFRARASMAISSTSVLFMVPFAIKNLVQGRVVLGLLALVVIAALVLNVVMAVRGADRPLLALMVLVPSVGTFLVLAYQEQGVIGALWSYPAVISFSFMFRERLARIANAILVVAIAPVAFSTLDDAIAARVIITLLLTSVFSMTSIRVIESQQADLLRLATLDPLTGARNRLGLQDRLDDVIDRTRATGTPATLLALDIDHFKRLNDRHGHDVGDRALCDVVAACHRVLDDRWPLFRVGGEEFVIAVETEPAAARAIAEAIRTQVVGTEIITGVRVTVSIGIAAVQPDDTARSLTRRADDHLYRAKKNGRNQVVSDHDPATLDRDAEHRGRARLGSEALHPLEVT